MARRRRKQRGNLWRYVLYLRADDPDNEALIEELEHAAQFNRCSKRLEGLAKRGLQAEQNGSSHAALPAPAPDDEAKYRVRRDRPREAPQTASEPPPSDGKDALARATNNFLRDFGK